MSRVSYYDTEKIPVLYRRFLNSALSYRGEGAQLSLHHGVTVRQRDVALPEYAHPVKNWTVFDSPNADMLEAARYLPSLYRTDSHALIVKRVYTGSGNRRKPNEAEITRVLQFGDFVPCYCDRCASWLRALVAHGEDASIPVRGQRVNMTFDQWTLRFAVAEANGIDRRLATAHEEIDAVLNRAEQVPVRQPYRLDLRTLVCAGA